MSRSSTETTSTRRSRRPGVSEHERGPREPERRRGGTDRRAPAQDARGALQRRTWRGPRFLLLVDFCPAVFQGLAGARVSPAPTRSQRATSWSASWLVEPDVEERIQLPVGLALGERDQVLGRGVGVRVLRVPAAQDTRRTACRRSSLAAPGASSPRGRRPGTTNRFAGPGIRAGGTARPGPRPAGIGHVEQPSARSMVDLLAEIHSEKPRSPRRARCHARRTASRCRRTTDARARARPSSSLGTVVHRLVCDSSA